MYKCKKLSLIIVNEVKCEVMVTVAPSEIGGVFLALE